MERKERAFAGFGWGLTQRRMVRLAWAAISMAVAGGVAHAAPDSGCQAINSGALNVELGTESSATRAVALKAGDTLTFNFDASAGPFGTLTLLKGPGAPRALLVGPTGTNVSFVAAKAGAFDFEFSKEGADAASFAVSCTPAERRAGRTGRRQPRVATRSCSAAPGPMAENCRNGRCCRRSFSMPVFRLRTAAAPQRAGQAPRPRRTQRAPVHAGAVDMRMQWRGRTLHGGRPGWGRDRQRGQRRRGRVQLQGSSRDHGRRPGPGRSTA